MCTEDELRSVITVHFEVDGVQYEVDLCEQHKADWDSLERARRQFAQVARAQTEVLQPTRAPSSRRGNDSPERREENRELRVWAQQEGIELPRAGRIPEEIRTRFRRWRWEQNHPLPDDTREPAQVPPTTPRPGPPPNAPRPPADDERPRFSVEDAMATYGETRTP
jgi:hypothetical protein